jgi:NTE family protein
MTTATPSDVRNPVREIPGDADTQVEDGIAVCLSGGGYRAMVFHVGVLWRLNETKLLSKVQRFSTVSGGSITAGVLAQRWPDLNFVDGVARDFVDAVVAPVRRMAGTRVDIGAVALGSLLPGTISDKVVKAYRKHLFGDATLQDLPDKPRFVFNATNLESGVLFRFSKPYLADYRVGRILNPDVALATAVAASSAFPPVLSPCTLNLEDERWTTDDGNDLTGADYRGEIKLTDGGVYDNLGLETAWKRYKTVFVSDAGGHVDADPDPGSDWLRGTARVLNLIDHQVRCLRKRQVIDALAAGTRNGMYVGIRSDVADFPVTVLTADHTKSLQLADLPTRLDAMDGATQDRLINWGYTVCDAGLRSHVLADELANTPATALPYPGRGLE